jgi:hypothetical protein
VGRIDLEDGQSVIVGVDDKAQEHERLAVDHAKTWRHLTTDELKRDKARTSATELAASGAPVDDAPEARSPATVGAVAAKAAKGAERVRRATEKQGRKALRAATGAPDREPTPVEKAAAAARVDPGDALGSVAARAMPGRARASTAQERAEIEQLAAPGYGEQIMVRVGESWVSVRVVEVVADPEGCRLYYGPAGGSDVRKESCFVRVGETSWRLPTLRDRDAWAAELRAMRPEAPAEKQLGTFGTVVEETYQPDASDPW